MARYLKRQEDGYVYPWTEALSGKRGMLEITAEEARAELGQPEPATEEAPKPKRKPAPRKKRTTARSAK